MFPVSRREARIAAMRVIYAAIVNGEEADIIVNRLMEMDKNTRSQAILLDSLVLNIIRVYDLRRDDINDWIRASSRYPFEWISFVERAVMTSALSEMLSYPEIDTAIVINEAVDLTNQFSSDRGYSMVNGILSNIILEQFPSLQPTAE